jgi:hypothetical protein
MKNIYENIRYTYKKDIDKQCIICTKIKKSKNYSNIVEIDKKNKHSKYKNLKPHRILQFYLIDLIWFMNIVIVYISGRIFC